MFFKVISDFGVSRLFTVYGKELGYSRSRWSRIASFCRRDLQKKLEVLQQETITQKQFSKNYGLNKPKISILKNQC